MVPIRVFITVVGFVIGLTLGGLISGGIGVLLVGAGAYQRAFNSQPWGVPALATVGFYLSCALVMGFVAWRVSKNWTRRLMNSQVISDTHSAYHVRGGARRSLGYGMNLYATWPFASLLLSSQQLKLDVMGKYFTFAKDEGIRLIRRRRVFSPGLEIVTSQGDKFVFWTLDMNRLVAKVQSFGYAVTVVSSLDVEKVPGTNGTD